MIKVISIDDFGTTGELGEQLTGAIPSKKFNVVNTAVVSLATAVITTAVFAGVRCYRRRKAAAAVVEMKPEN